MEKLLGEVAKATEIQKGQLVWHDGHYLLVTEVTEETGLVVLHLLGGETIHAPRDKNLIRGWRFLVGRRIG